MGLKPSTHAARKVKKLMQLHMDSLCPSAHARIAGMKPLSTAKSLNRRTEEVFAMKNQTASRSQVSSRWSRDSRWFASNSTSQGLSREQKRTALDKRHSNLSDENLGQIMYSFVDADC